MGTNVIHSLCVSASVPLIARKRCCLRVSLTLRICVHCRMLRFGVARTFLPRASIMIHMVQNLEQNPQTAGEILKLQVKSWNHRWNPKITGEILKSQVKSWNRTWNPEIQNKSWNHRWNLKITRVKSEITGKLKSRIPDLAVSDPSIKIVVACEMAS